jgi:hypothetical protein
MLPSPDTYTIDESKLQDFVSSVKHSLENFLDGTNNEIIDYDSAEFNISYNNQLELENICINNDTILDELDDILVSKFKDFYCNTEENE